MKKFISFFLILALILPCVLIHASANENTSQYTPPTKTEVDALACQIFPEYAHMIRGEVPLTSARSRTSENRELILSETRKVSDNREMTYMEYSDGITILADKYVYDEEMIVVQKLFGSNYTITTCALTLSCNFSPEVFQVSELKYTIYEDAYDVINNRGDLCDSTTHSSAFMNDYNLYESNTSDAYCKYKIYFTPSSGLTITTPFQVILTFYVGNDTWWVTTS